MNQPTVGLADSVPQAFGSTYSYVNYGLLNSSRRDGNSYSHENTAAAVSSLAPMAEVQKVLSRPGKYSHVNAAAAQPSSY